MNQDAEKRQPPAARGADNVLASDATIASDPAERPVAASHSAAAETIDSAAGSAPAGSAGGFGALGQIGPYVILQEVGRGAQGVVYRAVQLQTNRAIALKCMIAGPLASPRMRQRFAREVRTAASLNHPNIVTVYAVDEVDGRSMLAMEWIDGVPVDKWARAGGALGRRLNDNIALMIRICDAVHHAHQQGVIHRDLKPTNILVDANGEPHLLDFGLAKLATQGADQAITMTEEFVGTPAYAAPEQFSGDIRAVDVRTDVYALGVMLFEMLTGVLPYDLGRNISEWIDAICHREPMRPTSLNRRLDREIDAIALKALAKEKSLRYPSVDAFATDLRRYLAGEPVLAHAPNSLYYLRKLVMRHKLVSASVALLFISVTTFAYLSSMQAQRNAKLRVEAEAGRTEALNNLNVAEREAYFASIASASDKLRAGELDRARARLSRWQERASSQLKNFEWAFLTRWLDEAEIAAESDDAAPPPDGEIRLDTGKPPIGIASLPDAARVAVVSADELAIWNVLRGAADAHAPLVDRPTVSALSGDGRKLLVGFAGGVEIYETRDLHSLGRLTRSSPVSAICATNADELFAIGDEAGNVMVSAFDPIKPRAEFSCGAAVRTIEFSFDGQSIVLADAKGNLQCWDFAPPQPRRRYSVNAYAGVPRALEIAPDRDMLVTLGEDGLLSVWDAKKGEKQADFDEAVAAIHCVAFHPSGSRLATSGADGVVTLWDVQAREEALAFARFEKPPIALAFSPDGALLIAADADGGLRVWQASQTAAEVVELMAGHSAPIEIIESIEADNAMEPWFRKMALRLARERARQ